MSTIIHVKTTELPVYCPVNDNNLWCEHPRVFIELDENNTENKCPYCGTKFKLDV
ncbi:zinc-finger domain-containing protein [Thiotrichales bacterium 19S9-12]|nr:zinc-finger domain-containing protein [Thiotrichales bacterium 19S9-11]MCF6811444.1 zinc-finger domain-containing protein [Thiotrichales bacterium 19S9-12]